MPPRRFAALIVMVTCLLLVLALPAIAQQRAQTPPGQPPSKVQRAPQTTPLSEQPAAEAQLSEQDQAWVDQEMYKLRRDLVRDAVNRMRTGTYSREDRSITRDILRFMGPFLVFLVITAFVLWFLRTLLENRRWDKMARIQTDVHTKLLDKLGTSPELVAYIESEAGKRFLEATPFDIDHARRPAAPFSRILWSAQAGVIIIVLGAGLLWLTGRFTDEDARGLLVFGTLCLALGVGFLFSGMVSYALAKRFGLLNPESKTPTTDEALGERPR